MNQYSNQDKVWLVKSSGKVLGPYSADEMKFLLERRRISIIDEVRDPKMRWGFVRENPLFLEIVESLRDEEAQALDNTTEVDLMKTRTITAIPDELTPTPAPIPVGLAGSDAKPPESLPKMEEVSGERKSTTPSPSAVAKVQAKSNYWGPLAGLVVVLGILGSAYMFLGKVAPQKSLTTQDLIRLARVHKELGFYDKSLGFYQKAASFGSLDPRSSLDEAKLLLEVKSQTVEAQRILEGIIPNLGPNDMMKDEARLVLGLSYLKVANYDRANQIFSGLLNSSQQLVARLNLGLTKYFRSDNKSAMKDLNAYTAQGGTDGVAIIAKAMTLIRIHDSDGVGLKRNSVVEELDRYIRSSTEYKLEALLIRAVIHQKLNEKEAAQKVAVELLEEDPFLTRNHIHDLLVDRTIVRWDGMNENCDQLAAKWNENPLGKAIQGFCHMQVEDYERARINIEEGRKQFPKNPQLNSLYAYLLNRIKRISESQEIAPQFESVSPLSARVAAMNCEELQNPECAVKKWELIRERHNMPLDLEYLRGKADYEIRRNHRDAALGLIKEGLGYSPNYRPLIELKEKLDAP